MRCPARRSTPQTTSATGSAEGAEGAVKVLAAGKYLNKQVNFDELADRAVTDRGLAVWYVNLMASHPILTWRAHALRDRTQPGRLFWRPTENPVKDTAPRVRS